MDDGHEFDLDPRGFFGECNFLHRRIGRALKGAVGGFLAGGPAGALAGGAAGLVSGGRQQAAVPGNLQISPSLEACLPGDCRQVTTAVTRTGGIRAAFERIIPGGATGFEVEFAGPTGEAVMGRFGVAMVPASRVTDTAVCLPGMVVGKDGLCYNKGDLKNSERMWPKGRKPLLTGGELNAITKANAAAKRIMKQTARLRKLHMIPPASKPARRQKVVPTVVVAQQSEH